MLTMAGRTTQIKSTLNILPDQVMQYTKTPKEVISTMDHYQRNFLWGKKKLHLLKWNTIQKPKCQGGLGIQNLTIKNNAFLGDLAWRLFKFPATLWASLLIAKYTHHTTTNQLSQIWKAIQLGWNFCQQGIVWNIATGRNIRFWTGPWIGPTIKLRNTIEGPLPSQELVPRLVNIYPTI